MSGLRLLQLLLFKPSSTYYGKVKQTQISMIGWHHMEPARTRGKRRLVSVLNLICREVGASFSGKSRRIRNQKQCSPLLVSTLSCWSSHTVINSVKEFSLHKDDLCVLQFPSDYVQQNRSFEWQSWLQSLVEDSSTKKYDFSLVIITKRLLLWNYNWERKLLRKR